MGCRGHNRYQAGGRSEPYSPKRGVSVAEHQHREGTRSWRDHVRGNALRRAAWAVLGGGLVGLAGWLALPLVPLPSALFADQASELEFLDRAGQPLRAVRHGSSPFRHWVEYGEIPQGLLQATLAAEDRRFWQHPGVDWRASVRAAWQLALHRRVLSGGSTIT